MVMPVTMGNNAILERVGRALGLISDGSSDQGAIKPTAPTDTSSPSNEELERRRQRWLEANDAAKRNLAKPDSQQEMTTEPVPRAPPTPFVGDEGRADETGRPSPPAAPGQPTGMTVPGQDYPTNTAVPTGPVVATPPGRGGGGGRGAIDTRWKALGDQTRTEAYDPDKDMGDPRNIHATDPRTGEVRPWVNQRVIMNPDGSVARVENPVTPASKRPNVFGDGGDNNVANDMTTPIKAGVSWLHKIFHQDTVDQHTENGYDAMVHHNVGAPDADVAHMVLQTVDPKGELPMNRRMELSIRALHDFYMARADASNDPEEKKMLTEKAGKAAGEMMQFSVKMSKLHGEQAAYALAKGDQAGAIHQLQAGYGWLADGHHVEQEGNNLVVYDNTGKVTHTEPITSQGIKNLVAGMASGEFGHDIYRSRAQAQPATAEGGTSATMQTSGAPNVSAAAPSTTTSPAQSPAAPAGPKPSPAAPATVNIGALTSGSTGQSNQAIQTAPPLMPGEAPAAPTPVPAAKPDTTQPDTTKPTVTQPSKTETKPDTTKPVISGDRPQAELDKEEKEAFSPPKDRPPFHRYKTDDTNATVDLTIAGNPTTTMKISDAQTVAQEYYRRMNDSILKDTVGKPKARAALLESLKLQHGDLLKQINEARTRADAADKASLAVEQKHLEPHYPGESERQLIQTTFKQVREDFKKEAAADPKVKAQYDASVLRYSDDPDAPYKTRKLDDLAMQIKIHNKDLSPEDAYKAAIQITTMVPDTLPPARGEKEGRPVNPKDVFNGHAGRNGAYFRVENRDAEKQVVITTAGGHTISLTGDDFKKAMDMRKANYDEAHAKSKKAKELEGEKYHLLKEVGRRFIRNNPLMPPHIPRGD